MLLKKRTCNRGSSIKLKYELKTLKGRQNDETYVSAKKGCTNQNCIDLDTKFSNGYFTRYDVVSHGFDNYIPG